MQFQSILSNIVKLIGFALGLIVVQLDNWHQLHQTLSFVCLYSLAHLHVAKSLADQQIIHEQHSRAVCDKTTDIVCSQSWVREREKEKAVCLCWPTFMHREKGRVSSPSNLLCLGIRQDAVVATATLRHTASQDEETSSYFRFPSPVLFLCVCLAVCPICVIMEEAHFTFFFLRQNLCFIGSLFDWSTVGEHKINIVYSKNGYWPFQING